MALVKRMLKAEVLKAWSEVLKAEVLKAWAEVLKEWAEPEVPEPRAEVSEPRAEEGSASHMSDPSVAQAARCLVEDCTPSKCPMPLLSPTPCCRSPAAGTLARWHRAGLGCNVTEPPRPADSLRQADFGRWRQGRRSHTRYHA